MAVELTTIEKIKLIADRRGVTNTQLAASTSMTRQNLSNKISRGDMRESELRKIAAALGCSLKLSFVFDDTGEEI